jgi:hypothetical protein
LHIEDCEGFLERPVTGRAEHSADLRMRGRLTQLGNNEIDDLHDRFTFVALRQKGSLREASTPGPRPEGLKVLLN